MVVVETPAGSVSEGVIAFLRGVDAYPDRTTAVEVIETHMAWVFLTDHHAYKLKRPVKHPFLDFSTIEARRRDAEEEVRLNRRLARNVYLDVTPVTIGTTGAMQLGGSGRPVDWLVKMRRLPKALMLDALITNRAVTARDVASLIAVLSEFFHRSARISIPPEQYVRRFQVELEAQCRELLRPEFGLPGDLVVRALTPLLRYCHQHSDVLARRAEGNHIIDGHGDMRPEHVCLETPPVVIDCIEFNATFRAVDPADEIAFLTLECERIGGMNVAGAILDGYRRVAPNPAPVELLRFYRAYRAGLRAKLSVWHLLDHPPREHARWRRKAEAYLLLAIS